MNRFLYWSIYGGSFLLSVTLIAASVMAMVGFVPFRSSPPVLASAADSDSFSEGRTESPSHDNPPAATVRREQTYGWDAVWRASSEPAGAGLKRVGGDDRLHDNGSTQLNRAEMAPHTEPGKAVVVTAETGVDQSAPDAPVPPGVMPPAAVPDGPPRDGSSNGAPLIVAGLWPAVPPNTQPDPPVDEPADDPDTDEPTDGDQGDSGGGDGGETNRDPLDQESPQGPLRLSLVPGHDEVTAGEIVSVQVVLSEADRISSVPFHVRFNSEVLEYVGAKSGPAIVSSPVQPILLAAVNPARPDDLAVGLALVRSSGRFSGSGTVVVLDFRALQAGRSDLLLEKASVRDTNSRPLTVQLENSALSVR